MQNLHRIVLFQRISPIRSVCQASVCNSRLLPQRSLSTNADFTARQQNNDEPSSNQNEIIWRRIFHFHEMSNFAAMTKLKFYPMLTSAVMVPIMSALQQTEIMPKISLVSPLLMGTF